MNGSNRNRKLVAALLAGVLSASSGFAQSTRVPSEGIAGLIKQTSAHFSLSFRMHPNEAQHRQSQLEAVVAAWRAAPRTAANDEQMAKWLRSAIRASMPGQRTTLPPAPDFQAAASVEKPAIAPVIRERSMITERASAVREADKPGTNETHEKSTTDQAAPSEELDGINEKLQDAVDSNPIVTELEPVVAPLPDSDETTDPFRDDPIEETASQ